MPSGVTPELLELIAKAAANLKVAHGQLREIERALASMPQAEQPELSYRCEHCIGGQGFKSQARLEEHLANVHALGLDEAPTLRAAQDRVAAALAESLGKGKELFLKEMARDDEQSAKDAARHAQRVLDALTRDPEPVKPSDLLYPGPRARDDERSANEENDAA